MENETKQKDSLLPASILVSTIILAGVWLYTSGPRDQQNQTQIQPPQKTSEGIILPIRWGDLGVKMVSASVIDAKKFEQLYANREGLNNEAKELLYGDKNGNLKITSENSGMILNLLWALGLGAKNDILESGPIAQYGDTGNFASTGGWTIAKGNAMDHYSKHAFFKLTPEQQALVENVSKNIYRPCCDNSTNFPDCNHGMAMLGLLEIMASQGISEKEMYKTALQVNSFWFPEEYAAIARYFASKGQTLSAIDPKEILGRNYSSASGFRKIAALVPQVKSSGGGGCGVDSGQPTAPQQQSGCGI
ncbi:hypothetical protein A3B05_03230 [Candidatus Giovannonibacteria bacterium RIFCSPLOWO2_01_FULL_43_160]|uniref:Uncharacterized protein n=2 Tax=Candidatus Giovannoniibacteriota TaxID=1752738 RepID=A0A0G1L479_9BACT|nr:MAG: hypothetical protein UV72_C0005G0025 [Candidatus Giovannonibacteria bacterium GW2011_GWB1_43_13]KKS99471.1 MAG: hypothetical protein UV75_C0004G0025 [Candidatus Giovannonibacteria bacterium GW2011_GWA1_43_15]KKT21666.1 MAG: hypothetical protein UW05_C0005G0007 [Candidatus Giovannonibacteria bacterium GW2011_GWC2_43_8]KKT63392.1 MAG: hypothetical protein UW55_C0004G0025 [Candidatus Giovannonibacteria bacterium GW2011_GWA2_44_26]OGF58950.1 MAG: hypothetical protein A2652_03160 [Candidatus